MKNIHDRYFTLTVFIEKGDTLDEDDIKKFEKRISSGLKHVCFTKKNSCCIVGSESFEKDIISMLQKETGSFVEKIEPDPFEKHDDEIQ